MSTRTVFIAGATGYMGRRLAAALLDRGHAVRALARPGSETKIPTGCFIVRGNALDAATYVDQVSPADTFPPRWRSAPGTVEGPRVR